MNLPKKYFYQISYPMNCFRLFFKTNESLRIFYISNLQLFLLENSITANKSLMNESAYIKCAQ